MGWSSIDNRENDSHQNKVITGEKMTLQTKGILVSSILLFSFLAIPSFAVGQDNCCSPMMGMMKNNSMSMMNNNPRWWSKQDHNMGCPWQNYGVQEITNFTKEEAGRSVEDYLFHYGNSNLKVGNVKEEDNYFEVEVITKDNSLVEKIRLNKTNGWMATVR